MEIEGRAMTQRKATGASLLTKIRIAARERIARRWTVGRIGGFDLTSDVRPGRRDERLQSELVLERTDFPHSIDIDGETTAIGIIARLEHVLDRMDAEIEEQSGRVTDAQTRLAGFEPRLGEVFPLQGELDAKLAQLAADLASTERIVNGDRSILASFKIPSLPACWLTDSSPTISVAPWPPRPSPKADARELKLRS